MALQNMNIIDMTKIFIAIDKCITTPDYSVGLVCSTEHINQTFDFALSVVPAVGVELVNPYEIIFTNGSRLAVYPTETSVGRGSKQIITDEL